MGTALSRILALGLVAGAAWAGTPEPETVFITTSRELMSTRIDVSLPEDQAGEAERVFAEFARVEATANEWKEGTALTAVNLAAGGDPVTVPAELFALTRRGVEIGELTHGAFDVTWAALWGLWDFRTPGPVPSDADIAARTALVDYRRLELDEAASSLRLPVAGMKIGLGGIAKGYALDRSAAALRAAGVTDFLLSAGGQVQAGGDKNGRPWRVGIRDPRSTPDDYFGLVAVSDTSLSTSGDYERYFVEGGVRYHHILDPRTGRPARGLRSATVICAEATLADALSTAVMVLGKEAGLGLVASLEGVEAVVVDSRGKAAATHGVDVVMVHPPTP